MKKWLCIGLLMLYLLPKPGMDLSELHPVGLLLVRRTEGAVEILTDTGDYGTGRDVSEAIGNLEDSCPGMIYMETVEKLIVSDAGLAAQLKSRLRPSVMAVLGRGEIDPEEAAGYLRAHDAGRKLMDADLKLPVLIGSEGRYHIEQPE